jgi:very-short-patch-repair endonuclease
MPYNGQLRPAARELRKHATTQENHLWYGFLRGFQPRFTRQRIVGNYILDFYCPKALLAIELDGPQHRQPGYVEHDLERTAFLEQYQIEVMRVKNGEIDYNFSGVCRQIAQRVAEKAPKA